MAKGTIYLESHNRGGIRGTKFYIWCAEIDIGHKRYRKRSMERHVLENWLNEIAH